MSDAGFHWIPYLSTPELQLTGRSYDAVGFWARLAESGADPWTLLKSLQKGPASTAYKNALSAGGPTFPTFWAPGFVRRPDFAPVWDVRGPGLKTKATASRHKVSVGSITPLMVAHRTNRVYSVDFAGAEVVDIVGDAPGMIRFGNGLQAAPNGGTWCVKPGGCECPGGRSGPPDAGAGDAVVALSGARGDDRIDFVRRSLSKYCSENVDKSNLVLSGDVNLKMTNAARCKIDGSGNYTAVIEQDDPKSSTEIQFLSIRIDAQRQKELGPKTFWGGAENTIPDGQPSPNSAYASLTNAAGRSYVSYRGDRGVQAGTGQGNLQGGTVNSAMWARANAGGPVVRVDGTFTCG